MTQIVKKKSRSTVQSVKKNKATKKILDVQGRLETVHHPAILCTARENQKIITPKLAGGLKNHYDVVPWTIKSNPE